VNPDGSVRKREDQLARAVFKAEYPTPSASIYGTSGNGTGNNTRSRGRASLETMARTGNWPTPSATLGSNGGLVTEAKGREGGTLIEAISARTNWPTPTGKDSENSGAQGYSTASGRHSGTTLTDAAVGPRGGGQENPNRGFSLSPEWDEWLMNWPPGLTKLEPLGKEVFDAWLQLQRIDAWAQALQAALSHHLEDNVCKVRFVKEEELGETPPRWRPDQQLEEERPDPLLLVPRDAAQPQGPLEGQEDDEGVRDLQCDVPVQEAEREDLLTFLRRQADGRQSWWFVDPADEGVIGMERAKVTSDFRKARLQAIGNGQVPLCAAVAFMVLMCRANDQ